jgi:hypothetical protein
MHTAELQFIDNLIAVIELLLLPYATQAALRALQKIGRQSYREFPP